MVAKSAMKKPIAWGKATPQFGAKNWQRRDSGRVDERG